MLRRGSPWRAGVVMSVGPSWPTPSRPAPCRPSITEHPDLVELVASSVPEQVRENVRQTLGKGHGAAVTAVDQPLEVGSPAGADLDTTLLAREDPERAQEAGQSPEARAGVPKAQDQDPA